MYHPSEKSVEDICLTADHIRKVKNSIDNQFPSYFQTFLKSRNGNEISEFRIRELSEHFGHNTVKQDRSIDQEKILQEIIDKSIESYESDTEIYRNLLEKETLEMYSEDISAFKSDALRKECPIMFPARRSFPDLSEAITTT